MKELIVTVYETDPQRSKPFTRRLPVKKMTDGHAWNIVQNGLRYENKDGAIDTYPPHAILKVTELP